MAELPELKLKWVACGTPQLRSVDFLGRLIGDKSVRNAERSAFEAYDLILLHNPVDMFNPFDTTDEKIRRVGWSMEYEKNSFQMYKGMPQKNLILFPTELLRETIEIFQDLKDTLRQYEFVICLRKATYKE